MKHLKFSTAVTSLIIIVGAQFAARSVNAESENWSGSYFGMYFGSGQGNANTSFTDNDLDHKIAEGIGALTQTTTTNRRYGQLRGNMTGSVATALVGYNFHPIYYSKLVFGGQLEGVFFRDLILSTHGYRHSSTIITIDDGTTISRDLTQTISPYEFNDELASMFTFIGRGGYLIKPNILAYLLGGGAQSNFVLPTTDGLIGENRGRWVLGYTVGAGLEYRLNNQWSFRGEYRFLNFNISRNGSSNLSENTDPEAPNNNISSFLTTTTHYKTDANFNMGTIGVVYQIPW